MSLPSPIFDNGPGAISSWSPVFAPFRDPDHHWPMAQSRVMPTFVVAANGLLQQKSDCETFVSTHVAADPCSTDVDARADINEAMTSADAECERWRAEHVHDDPSLQRALFMIPACQTWLTCSYLALGGAATKGIAVFDMELWLLHVRGH